MEKPDRESQDLQKSEKKGTIEMVISPSNNPTQLLRFMFRLEKTYKGDNHSASIIRAGGSFDRGAFIAISLRSNSPADIVNEISNMPEVETVEEDPPASGAFSRFSTVFTRRRLSCYIPNNRFRIILNGINKDKVETRDRLITVEPKKMPCI